MVGKFIGRIFGRPLAGPENVQEALQELTRLAQEKPVLAIPAAVLGDVLAALYEQDIRERPPEIGREPALAKLAGGVPLLRGETLSVDARAFRRRWLRVAAAVRRHQGGEAPTKLMTALRRGRLVPQELVQHVLAGRPESIHACADRHGLDAGLTATVLRLTLFPVFAKINVALAPLRSGMSSWPPTTPDAGGKARPGAVPGYCPTCGSWPLLGEYRGLEQSRLLRCGLCAAEWALPRLACPFCGSRDHRVLGYVGIEGEDAKYRAATCDACRGYVKMVATLGALSGPRLLVADLATMHLDLAAAERGYAVPG